MPHSPAQSPADARFDPVPDDDEWFPATPDLPPSESNGDTGDYPVNHPAIHRAPVTPSVTPPPSSATVAPSTETAAAGEQISAGEEPPPETTTTAQNEPDPDSVPGNHLVPEDDRIALDLVIDTGDGPCAFEETGIAGAIYEDIDDDGRFEPDDEPGIPALRVLLIQVDALGPEQDAAIRETVTDSQGFYDFFGVPPRGLYRIAVDDFVLGPDVAVSAPDALDTPIEITAEDCYPNRNVGYLLLHTIEGRVWEDLNVDGQPNEDTPLTFDIQIQLSKLGPGGESIPVDIEEPDPVTGRFAFDNVRPGTYRVEPVRNYVLTTEAFYVVTCRGGLTTDTPPPPAQFGVVVVTPIELASFSAVATGAGNLVSWHTAVELENLGFNLYRSAQPDGARIQINPELILGRGTSLGGDYQFLDEGGAPGAWYWLEDIDWHLRTTLNGPVLPD